MPLKPSLSAVIIAKNEATLFEGCLKTLGFCDEIIVVIDAASSDKTEAIAKKYATKVLTRQFDTFASQRNFGLEQARGDWLLSVDADERVTSALAAEIRSAIQTDDVWGYRISNKPYVFGVELKHSGWSPSFNIRLFKRDGRYGGEVHETVAALGPIRDLTNPFVHYNYFDVSHFLHKLNQYTSLEAVKDDNKGLIFKPRMVITGPAREFAYRYIKQSGWKDGFMGLVIALLMAAYRLAKVVKLWERQRGIDTSEIYRRLDETLQ